LILLGEVEPEGDFDVFGLDFQGCERVRKVFPDGIARQGLVYRNHAFFEVFLLVNADVLYGECKGSDFVFFNSDIGYFEIEPYSMGGLVGGFIAIGCNP